MRNEKNNSQEKVWKGMHNGTVAGKGFEKSRRSRKSHTERRNQIVYKSKK